MYLHIRETIGYKHCLNNNSFMFNKRFKKNYQFKFIENFNSARSVAMKNKNT